jgi:uncharacterized RDD family membrane protein YckC
MPSPEPATRSVPTATRPSPMSEAVRAGETAAVGDATRRATWTRRAPALVIDIAPNLGAAIVLGIAYANFLLTVLHEPDNGAVPRQFGTAATTAVVGGVLALLALGWTLFNRWLRGGHTGQSLGKRVLRIRLVSENTAAPIGAFQAFVRDLVHILDALTCVGYLWPLWDERRQTFADMLMNTVVIEVLPTPKWPGG